jgi:hypothetical protein
MDMKHIEFILLWVSFILGEEFQGRKECAEGGYCCNWTFVCVSVIFPFTWTVQNYIYCIHYRVFTLLDPWGKDSRVAILAVCCLLLVTDFVSSFELPSSEVYSTILLSYRSWFKSSVCSHSVNPWPYHRDWMSFISLFFFCLSDLTVPYESRIITLQRTMCLCSRPVQSISQYSSWFHS